MELKKDSGGLGPITHGPASVPDHGVLILDCKDTQQPCTYEQIVQGKQRDETSRWNMEAQTVAHGLLCVIMVPSHGIRSIFQLQPHQMRV
jgi:hypothetical protein